MYRLSRYLILPIILTVCCYAVWYFTPALSQTQNQSAYVNRVIDGDTIEVQIDSSTYKVRYIGIDTPETVKTNTPIQYYGKEASNKNKELVSNKTVYLDKDISETDKYGRLLRYVYLDSSKSLDSMVGYILVKQGYAKVATCPPDVRYSIDFVEAEEYARQNNLGLWAK